MKFGICAVLLACFSMCCAGSLTETLWGTETQDLLGARKVEVTSSFLQVKEYVFTYPEGTSKFPIFGIKHFDYKSHPVTVRFLKGGIGDYNVTILVTSQRSHGIKSDFLFFT